MARNNRLMSAGIVASLALAAHPAMAEDFRNIVATLAPVSAATRPVSPGAAPRAAAGASYQRELARETSSPFALVVFDLDKHRVRYSQRAELERVIEYLKRHPESRIAVDGYADQRDQQPRGEWMAQRRAERVKTYLMRHGIAAERVKLRGAAGARVPAGDAPPARVELRVLPR